MRTLSIWFVILVPLLVIAGLACGTDTGEGVVAHKSITGIRKGTSYTVSENRPSDDGSSFIHVDDKDLLSHFATCEEHLIISETLAFEVESRYDMVDCYVNMAPASSPRSGTRSYRVSRDVFNQLRVGDTVKFETKQIGDLPKIVKLIGAP